MRSALSLLLELLVAVGFVVVASLYMPTIEGWAMPVTSPIEVISPMSDPSGTVFQFAYTKKRLCELLGVVASKDGVTLDFHSLGGRRQRTRGLGRQLSSPWHLSSPTIEGVQISFIHRCSPLWITVTRVL